jgi:uncharacterized repeat protein (TIGR01451 family)
MTESVRPASLKRATSNMRIMVSSFIVTIVALMALGALLMTEDVAEATSYSFVGATTGTLQWTNTTGAVWSPSGGFPGSSSTSGPETAVIAGAGGPYEIDISSLITNALSSLSIGGCFSSPCNPTVQINAGGTLTISGGATIAATGTVVTGGTVNVASGGKFALTNDSTLTNNTLGTLNVTGTVAMDNATSFNNSGGTIDMRNTGIIFATGVTDTAGSTTLPLINNSGTLTRTVGSGSVSTVDPTFNNTGTVSTTTAGGSAGLLFTNAFNNNGTVTLNTGSLQLNGGGSDNGTGTYSLTGTTTLLFGGGTHTLASSFSSITGAAPDRVVIGSGAKLDISAPLGTLLVGPPLNNNGGILSLSGSGVTLSLNGGYTQNFVGTTTIAAGDTLSSPLDIVLAGGFLEGNGSLAVTGAGKQLINSGGVIDPGTPGTAGSLSLTTGGYQQGPLGTLNIDITASTLYDKFFVSSGAATLAGTLNVSLGYVPTVGTSWPGAMTYSTVTGDFGTKNLPSFAGGVVQEATTLTAVNLAAVAAADMGITQTVSPSPTNGQNVTFTLSITNAGPSTATSVTVTDTLPSGWTFVSATPSTSCTYLSGTVSCSMGSMVNAGTATVTIVAVPNAAGSATNNANVSNSPEVDPNTVNNSSSVTVTVNPATTTTTIASSANPSTFGQVVTFTATVSGSGATGSVTFMDGAVNIGSGTLSAGTATFTTSALTGGAHSITAVYGGDSNFSGSSSPPLTQTVNAAATTTTLSSSANPSSFGQVVTFTATVSGSGATGSVTFMDGAVNIGSGTLSAGTVTFTTSSLTAGVHSITAVYSGNSNFATSTSSPLAQTVNQATTTTTLSSSANPSSFGQSITFTATVSGSGATGTVTFKDGGVSIGSGTLSAGTATFTTSTLTAGAHSITAVYSGDSNFSGSSSPTLTQTVSPAATTTTLSSSANPSTVGQSVTFTATVSGSGATGTVTFKDGGVSIGSGTLSAGTATFTTSTLTAGAHSITAVYSGDSNFTTSTSSPFAQTVNQAVTTTTLSSSPNPSTFGQAVTFTATVSGSGATGSVTFKDGATVLGSTALSAGSATFTTSSLTAGSHSITAVYGGDPSFSSSTSNVVTQVVTLSSTTTTLTSSVNPSAVGQPVTFTATVSPAGATGTVTFKDSAAVLGTAALSAGTATFTTSALSAGPHPISAVYSGDATFTSSTSATLTQNVGTCPGAVTGTLPTNGVAGVPTTGTLSWMPNGATGYNVYLGAPGSGCSSLFAMTSSSGVSYSGLTEGTKYEWKVVSVSGACTPAPTSCFTFTTATSCPIITPTLLSPTNGSMVTSPVTFSWTSIPIATGYDVFAGTGVATPTLVNPTRITGTTLTATIPSGPITWYVVTYYPGTCPPVQSPSGSFNSCGAPPAPLASVVGFASSGQTYSAEWPPVTGASSYELQEGTTIDFAGAATIPLTTTSKQFEHTTADLNVPFFYRVRALSSCNGQPGPYSPVIRVIIAPLPKAGEANPDLAAPLGSQTPITEKVFVPGFPGVIYGFSAKTDKDWLSVTPLSGSLPPEGLTFTLSADPSNLQNGTITGTLIVTLFASSSGRTAVSGNPPPVTIPVSINIVTPVTPGSKTTPPANSLFIPSVGHLDGVNSKWQSDIRVTNTGLSSQKYLLAFTPSGADAFKDTKQTTITVDAGGTTALDDIVKRWYGLGAIGDTTDGVLEIRPVTGGIGGGTIANDISLSAVSMASSRTYDITPNGTLGQFIGAVAFSSFIGKALESASPQILSLQQIAQTATYRTNFGLVEGSGNGASVMVSVFDDLGKKLADIPLELKAGEHRQLNGFLSQNGISLADGRIQVQVVSGAGKVTAYASVIDNRSNDPLLVSGTQLGSVSANHFVVPGVADINTGQAAWRTDLRIFNSSSVPQVATLTLHPQNDTGTIGTAQQVTINPSEVKTLDNLVQSVFGLSNAGGALHLTTPQNAALMITARTYNETSGGTFGQYIPAVTAADAVGNGDRPLNVLQVENSSRFRTNIGISEVTGNPAMVEISVVLPDSRVTPKVQIPIEANQFKQIPVLSQLGLDNTYNARVTVQVVGGQGKVSVYGSVIDQQTQDPTYVPAQ